ncbi:hypothetical protein M431DRAFT_502697 [Trichoderma harzianum CBS 226.95]|uniref:Uncharacterized protein n=1 Tax=Trichoderma harzianum CBS 226.95 TaxID=983964 RepID=A0A2T4AU38_TRIHA|nr:hypothetical protein M431DRAFT_502697 [Trichoderma harzianum CBS 226.95]PTB60559.1 hypothetical protein M431DRAFT_502697 [Trichoderma harzianum CBS 226.95]
MASGNMIFSLILPNVHNVLVANVSEHFHHARAQLEPYTSYVYGVSILTTSIPELPTLIRVFKDQMLKCPFNF